MFRKVLISTIVLVFFVSTTGLPLTIHLCSMVADGEMEACTMHSEMMQCENDADAAYNVVKIKREDCCKTEVKYESIGDKFLQINSQKVIYNETLIALLNAELFQNLNQLTLFQNYLSDSSPPHSVNNHLYLNNSILLI